MNKTIDRDYATLVLSEILMEENLINKETFEAIKEKIQSENRTFHQTDEKRYDTSENNQGGNVL